MNRKDAIAHARRESHTNFIRVHTWHKEKVTPPGGKGPRHEVALLIWEYDTKAQPEFGDDGHTWTRLQLFIDGRPSYGGYVGD